MMNNPYVSILIPVYNRNKFIIECIQSALNQTFFDIEVVVVDNASDDGTWEICQKISMLDARVRVFRNEENIGPVRNWIRCTKEARGEFSKILFSDDLLETTCIERMVEHLQKSNVAFVYSTANIGISKEKSYINYSLGADQLINSTDYVSLVINGQAPVSPGAVLIRTKDLIQNLHLNIPTSIQRPYEINGAGPDVMIMLLTANQYPNIYHINSALVFFRVHKNSFTIDNYDNKVTDGYGSAISWYLYYNKKRLIWIRYVTRIWLRNLKNKKIKNPYFFLQEYEGDGRISDVVFMLAFIPVIVIERVKEEIINRCNYIKNYHINKRDKLKSIV